MMPQETMPDTTRKPIENVETEAALIGALLFDNRAVDRVADIVSADDFYEPVHGRLYDLIVRQVSAGGAAGFTLLKPFVENDPGIQKLGGSAYLSKITGSGASLIGATEFAKQIADFAKRRRLYERMEALIGAAHSDLEVPVETLIDQVDHALTVALQRDHVAKSMSVAKAFDTALAEVEAEARGEGPAGITVEGFEDWNKLTGTMRHGEVVILAGRPSMGKTAVGLSAALGAARGGHGTVFISLEMSVPELMKRAITDLIFEYGQSANYSMVQRGSFTRFDRDNIARARAEIASWPLILHQDAGLKIGRLGMMIRRYKRIMAGQGKSLDVVVIDYLGLVRGDIPKAQRHEEVGQISRAIKSLAVELNVCIVLLAQLNREVERRDDKRPQLSDLRDSGEIEQDADAVLFVYREQYYLERSEPDPGHKNRADWELAIEASRDRLELISAKVRKGAIGKRLCYFFASHQAVRGSNFFSSKGTI